MHLTREPDGLLFSFNPIEANLLRRVLEQLKASYGIDPGDLDPRIAAAWYSTRGCQSAGMSPEDTQHWLEHLHEFKSARVPKIQGWLRQLAQVHAGAPAGAHAGASVLRLDLADADPFITLLNGHRLQLAARHEIADREMEVRSHEAMALLPIHQQEALIEIHILAWLIEVTLEAISTPFQPEQPGQPGSGQGDDLADDDTP